MAAVYAPEADEERVAERHLAGVAADEVEADRADPCDEGCGQQQQLVILGVHGDKERRENDREHPEALPGGVEQRHVRRVAGVELGAAAELAAAESEQAHSAHTRSTSGVPKSPYGRTSRTISKTT